MKYVRNLLLFVFCVLSLHCSSEQLQEQQEPDRTQYPPVDVDNHYYSHLGCYGDPVVQTPTIDQIAKDGVRFEKAFCASPSCTPARAALLAGQDIWRLGQGGNLWSTLADSIPIYTDLLERWTIMST